MQTDPNQTILLVNSILLQPKALQQLIRHVQQMPANIEHVPSIIDAYTYLNHHHTALTLICLADSVLSAELITLISDYRNHTTIVLIASAPTKALRTHARAIGATTVLSPSDFRSSLINMLLQTAWQLDQQRHQQATALMEQRAFEQLRTIISHHAHGVIVVDQEGRMQFMNTAAEQLFDRRAVEMLGKIVGFPVVVGESAEIDVVRHNDLLAVEMRVARTEWDGQVAAIISLRDFTERRQLHEAEAFSHAIFNSLTPPICVVDEQGIILAVNEAWTNGPENPGLFEPTAVGVGASYFNVCQNAFGSTEEQDANAALTGIQNVLSGDQDIFELEYPCHSPTAERWFLMRVVPLIAERLKRVVISHNNVTAQKIAARATAEAAMLRNQVRQQKHELAMIARIGRVVPSRAHTQYVRLRDQHPTNFSDWVRQYGEILDQTIEKHFHQTTDTTRDATQELAIEMGRFHASPRDIIDMHLTSMRLKSSGASLNKVQAYLEEGRVTVLTVMGHLASYYRGRRTIPFSGFRIRRSRHQTKD
jgi:PAS domain-containing protein